MNTVKVGALTPWPVLICGDALLEYDQLVSDLAAALARRDAALRDVTVIEHRIVLARLAAGGQTTMHLELPR